MSERADRPPWWLPRVVADDSVPADRQDSMRVLSAVMANAVLLRALVVRFG
jgi:hypothetical protein